MPGRNIVASLQRWTYLAPLAVAYTVGLITWQHWPYFLVMLILSFGPAIIGCADPVGELVDYVGRERRRREKALAQRATVAQHAVGFLRQIQQQGADELRLMAQCVIRGRNGFNRDATDPVALKLLERGLAVAETGFTPAGFPFYFTDRAWALMNALRDEVFAAHDRIGDTTLTPTVPPRRRFHLGWFVHDLGFLILKGPVLLIILLPMAGVAWFAWIGAMAAVILAMVSAGY
ncbi:MAG: hypothetical protein HQ495_02735, partial [Alphaproteobacteria bacterium]|nr:hypothetical protein [Alphaproteobacteria bacterium]